MLGHGNTDAQGHGISDGSWEDGLVSGASGGRFSMKSYSGALRKVFYRIAWPGSRGIIAGPNFTSLRIGTLPALFDVCKNLGLVYGQHYEYNVTNHEITWWLAGRNGPTCTDFVISLDNPRAPRGAGVADLWIDEAADVEEQAFLDLMPAVRQPGYPHQTWITFTPPSPYHWLYPLFCPQEAYDGGFTDRVPSAPLRGRYVLMYARTQDNPFGGLEEYEKNVYLMGGPDSPLARRELFGEWTILQGLVFPNFSPSKHMIPREQWPSKPTRFVAGVDFGFATYCAIVVIGLDDAGRVYLMEEFYRHELPEKTLINVALHLKRKYGIPHFFCDSADPGKISALNRARVPAYRADKRSRTTGVDLMAWAINGKIKDGTQRLYVDRGLAHFKAEMAGYVWEDAGRNRDVSEQPRKKNDHAIDAAVYGLKGAINRLHLDTDRGRSGGKLVVLKTAGVA